MADESEIELELEEIIDDLPEVEIEEEEVIKEPEKKAELAPDDALEALKEQLKQERNRVQEAERREREAAEIANSARVEAHDSNLHLVTNAISSIKQSSDLLKVDYANALADGDYSRAAEIQATMADNAVRLNQLEQGRESLERQPVQQYQPQQMGDPVEALASQLSPKSANWIRQNPQFATDQRLFQKMLGAHNIVMADGIQVDTDDYFSAIEDILKVKKDTSAQQQYQRKAAPAAAPVTRNGTGQGSRPNVVKLTALEREMAQLNGLSDQEYAKHKLALQKEGKLN